MSQTMNFISKILFLKPVIHKLSKLLTRRHKTLLVILLFVCIGFSLIETIGISAIMPFISIVSDPSLIENGIFKTVYDFLGFSSVNTFLITFGICIIIFYILRAVYSVLHAWAINRYSTGIYINLSKKVFSSYMRIPYKLFVQKNSAILMQSITDESLHIGKITLNLLYLLSELFTIIMIYALIVFLNWKMTVIITIILLLLVITLLTVITRINKFHGKKRHNASRNMKKTIKESLGNIKYIKLKGNEEKIINNYSSAINEQSHSNVIHGVLNVLPKGILESIGFTFLVGVIVFLIWFYNDASGVIPIISMYALALYRILPSINKIMHEINLIVFVQEDLDKIYECLQQPIDNEDFNPVAFNNTIKLQNINFKYLTGNDVLKDLSLEIKKGEKIAFTGESGSGKSTLIDIIIGIHKPNSGKLLIDDTEITNKNIRSWRKKIGYIPQSIYLFDGTAAENVCFGSEYNEEKIITALKKANIWDFLRTKEGINTLVGDGGIQLSGGQQQRIGIARALYDDPEILILDEATSALDNETEAKIMDEIYSVTKDKTLIVIAHRLTTVERCDKRIHIEDGRIC